MRIINNDYRRYLSNSWLKTNGQADLLLTDIPYNVKTTASGDYVPDFDLVDFDVIAFLKYMVRYVKPDANLLVFMSWEQMSLVYKMADSIGLQVVQPIIWHKLNPQSKHKNTAMLDRDAEVCLRLLPAGAKHSPIHVPIDDQLNQRFHESSIIDAPTAPISDGAAGHGTPKPLMLLRKLIEEFSGAGDLVIDPCAGSGSTAVACVQTDRRFRGCEIDATYSKLANNRLSDFVEKGPFPEHALRFGVTRMSKTSKYRYVIADLLRLEHQFYIHPNWGADYVNFYKWLFYLISVTQMTRTLPSLAHDYPSQSMKEALKRATVAFKRYDDTNNIGLNLAQLASEINLTQNLRKLCGVKYIPAQNDHAQPASVAARQANGQQIRSNYVRDQRSQSNQRAQLVMAKWYKLRRQHKQLTVSEFCATELISRATFYKYRKMYPDNQR